MMRDCIIVVVCCAFGVWIGMAAEDLHRADERAADLRMIQAAKDRCFLKWGKTK